jgi:hypothetical protein
MIHRGIDDCFIGYSIEERRNGAMSQCRNRECANAPITQSAMNHSIVNLQSSMDQRAAADGF